MFPMLKRSKFVLLLLRGGPEAYDILYGQAAKSDCGGAKTSLPIPAVPVTRMLGVCVESIR